MTENEMNIFESWILCALWILQGTIYKRIICHGCTGYYCLLALLALYNINTAGGSWEAYTDDSLIKMRRPVF